MYIWKITREKQKVSYDENAGHVIVADLSKQVRGLAASVALDEGVDVWAQAKVEKVGVYTGDNVNPFIVLTEKLNG